MTWMKQAKIKNHVNKTKAKIIQSCVSGNVSPEKLAKIYSVDARTVQRWVFKSCNFLPSKYKSSLQTLPLKKVITKDVLFLV